MKNVITRVKGSQPAPILLVANKFDLDCQREVSTAEGKLWLPNYLNGLRFQSNNFKYK